MKHHAHGHHAQGPQAIQEAAGENQEFNASSDVGGWKEIESDRRRWFRNTYWDFCNASNACGCSFSYQFIDLRSLVLWFCGARCSLQLWPFVRHWLGYVLD